MRTSYAQLLSFLTLLFSVGAMPSQPSSDSGLLADQRLEARDDHSEDGPGILLVNASDKEVTHNFYNNISNGNGTAEPNYDNPEKPTTLAPGADEWVSFKDETDFKGRVQRGTTQPATWVEFQIEGPDGAAHGDVSLEQGYDGPATITAMEGGRTGGFTNDVTSGAPEDSKVKKEDGTEALVSTEGNWDRGRDEKLIEYLEKDVTQEKAYIDGGTGVPDISSKRQQFKIVFH